MSDYVFGLGALALIAVFVFEFWRARRNDRRYAAQQKAWQLARDEESRELDRIMLESEQNAARHQAHLAQQKAYVPLVLPPKPSQEEQAKRDAAYQEAVASRYRAPTRVIDRQSKLITTRPYEPPPTTRTYEPTSDTSFTDTLRTAVAVSSLFDSDSSSSSPSSDPTPSWDSSDSSSGSGFGGGGSSGEW